MKRLKTILLIAFGLFSSNTFSQGHQIKVTVHGVPKDSMCRLANYFGDKQYLQDSALADASGSVIFHGAQPLPGGIYLFVLPEKRYFEMVVDKEQNFTMETDTADYVKHMKVTGSKDNELFYDYLNFIGKKSKEIEPLKAEYENAKSDKDKKAVQKKMDDLNKEVTGMKTKFMTDNPDAFMTKVFKTSQEVEVPDPPKNPDGTIDSTFQYRYYKAHFFDNIDMTDDRMLRTPVLFNKIEQYIKKLTLQIPDSINAAADYVAELARPNSEVFKFVVWWVTNTYETSNIMGMDAVFVHMTEKYYTADQAFWVDSTQLAKIQDRAKKLKPLLIGKKSRNLVLEDTAGVYRSLYDIKKPFTVLIFWDPDCGHCQKSMPKLKELYDKYKPKGVEIFAVNDAVEEEKWKKYIREHKLNWINVADLHTRNNFRFEYDLSSTPQIFLLDDTKTILAKRIDVETLGDILQRHIDTRKKEQNKE
ncbi:MAG TPA: thioredoxin-like domain-containing protein [Bacteroidia bacterium]|nr:thioredoxin-like domain-containing protein [Bacteroidia bacterium]